MAKLLIMESKHKAETVERFVGKGYKVIASDGHIIDLPKSSLGIDIEKNFKPKYILMRDKAKSDTNKILKNEIKKADEVLLASDPDREGEAIAWHLAQYYKIPLDKACRVTFNEITKKCVEESLKNPRTINLDLVDAQQARRVLDRLVGYQISPILWKKVKSGLSAGRVQSAVLKMIVDREREIEGFKPEEFWELDVKLSSIKPKKKFTARFYGDKNGKITLNNEAEADKIASVLPSAEYAVTEYKEGLRNQNTQAPFTTSTLQQDASHKLKFDNHKTMQVAQQLYEGVNITGIGAVGLVTYIRTDSVRVSEEAVSAVREYIATAYGAKYVPARPIVHKSKKKIQDAHEAIRPTNIDLQPDSIKACLTNEQYKLYKLIYNRFVASQMAPSKYATVSLTVSANDTYLFKASSSNRIFDGYLAVYSDKDDKDKSNSFPQMNVGDKLNYVENTPTQHFTQPPARYNNGSIVKEMEENGIGRPSTYSTIVDTILKRYYAEKLKGSGNLAPTPLGVCVSDIVSENFTEITDVKFTASMEEKLDNVADGKKDWVKVVSDFYSPFRKSLDKAGLIDKVEVPVVVSDIPCPNCGALLVERMGRYGKFLACPNYPECKTTQPLPENVVKEPCPACGGQLVQRISRKGKRFYGCTNYPDCHFAASGLPTGEKCPKCEDGYLIRGYNNKIVCNRFDCKYEKKNEDKTADE